MWPGQYIAMSVLWDAYDSATGRQDEQLIVLAVADHVKQHLHRIGTYFWFWPPLCWGTHYSISVSHMSVELVQFKSQLLNLMFIQIFIRVKFAENKCSWQWEYVSFLLSLHCCKITQVGQSHKRKSTFRSTLTVCWWWEHFIKVCWIKGVADTAVMFQNKDEVHSMLPDSPLASVLRR